MRSVDRVALDMSCLLQICGSWGKEGTGGKTTSQGGGGGVGEGAGVTNSPRGLPP